ncbi:hypothetical protein HNQ80_004025 [Anaerosolibacter carboniphilus]|uniref:Uncharacterized protein n=1 Tax=Anaerosolibacter carboniphilus TaxID=1417629 RepID=A0A841L674_9FIRM|nr:hypothetical protein [Anaerosolibacter carboniphilus]MBB6217889.1 hypothetical protein [Anaerosolibacter carboniphilus]
MNINSLSDTPFSSYKQMITQGHQRQENQPINKAAEVIQNRMNNMAVALELSKEGVQQLKLRTLDKAKKIEKSIEEKFVLADQKQKFLSELDKSINNVINDFDDFMEKVKDQISDSKSKNSLEENTFDPERVQDDKPIIDFLENNDISKELIEAANAIEENMSSIADMIEIVERAKAQRENSEYQEKDSITDRLKNADVLRNYMESRLALGQASDLIRKELSLLKFEISKLEAEIYDMLDSIDENQEKNNFQIAMMKSIKTHVKDEKKQLSNTSEEK